MERMNAKAFSRLKNIHSNIQYAIYLPIDPGPANTDSNTSRYNNTISTIKQVFADVDVAKKIQQRMLAKLRGQISAFARPLIGKSVAIYIFDDERVELYELGFKAVPALYYNLHHMHLEPLSRHYRTSAPYWVLTLSQNGCQLFKGDEHNFRPISDASIKRKMSDLLGIDEDSIGSVQHQTASSGTHDGSNNIKKKHLQDYFRIIDSRVHDYVKNNAEPIILVGVDHVQSLFMGVSRFKNITPSRMMLDPHKASVRNLQNLINPTLSELQAKGSL